MCVLTEWRIRGESNLGTEDAQRSSILKGMDEEAQSVQDASQSPDVSLLRQDLSHVGIAHFWCTIHLSRFLGNYLFSGFSFLRISHVHWSLYARTKINQFQFTILKRSLQESA